MPVILYVEELNSDKTVGYTTNQAMMLENASRIRIPDLKHTEDMVGLVFQAGRYIAFIVTDIEGRLGMMFIDFNKDKEKAEWASKKFAEDHRRVFMKNFYELNKNYKQNYNLIELVVDKNFIPDILAN